MAFFNLHVFLRNERAVGPNTAQKVMLADVFEGLLTNVCLGIDDLVLNRHTIAF